MSYWRNFFYLPFLFFFSYVFAQNQSEARTFLPPEQSTTAISFDPIVLKEGISQPDIIGKISNTTSEDKAFLGLLTEIRKKKELFRLSQVPLIKKLPESIKTSIFDKIIFRKPDFQDIERGISIAGQADFGPVSIYCRFAVEEDEHGKINYSVLVFLPNDWKLSDFLPGGKDIDLLKVENIGLVFTNATYDDPVLEREIKPGLNIIAHVIPTGSLFEKLDALSGGNITSAGTLTLHGVIGLNERLIGTMFMIDVGAGLKFCSWLETTPISLRVAIEESITQVPTVSISARGGLRVKLPQQDWSTFELGGNFIAPSNFEFQARQIGMIENFPLHGLRFGDIGFVIVTDPALMAESAGVLAIAGLGVQGTLGVGASSLSLQTKVALSGTTGIGDLYLIIEGDLRLKDFVGFILTTAEDAAHLVKKNVEFQEKLTAAVPDIELEGIRVALVPRETAEMQKQVEVRVNKVNLFGLTSGGMFYFDKEAISGFIYLPKIVIGSENNPLFYLAGSGETEHDGPIFKFNFNTISGSTFFADSVIGTSLLGGIHQRVHANLLPSGLQMNVDFMWGDLFESTVRFNIALQSHLDLKDIWADVMLKQNAQSMFADAIKNAAEHILGDLQMQIDSAGNKALKKFEKDISLKEVELAHRAAYIQSRIDEKTDECNRLHPSKLGKANCYLAKGIPFDKLKLGQLKLKKQNSFDVILKAGKAFIIAETEIAKTVVRPVGKVMKFCSNILKKGFNIHAFEARASLGMLAQQEALRLNLDMTLFGKRVEVKDMKFDIKKIYEFVFDLFDEWYEKNISKKISKSSASA